MIFNRQGMGYLPFLSSCYLGNVSSQMDISNGIFDELEIQDTLDSINSAIKSTDWTTDTYMQALFQNNLEGGSVSMQNVKIQKPHATRTDTK